MKPGDQILIDDGKIELKVLATDRDREVDVEVVYGGTGEAPQRHQPARFGGVGPQHDGEGYRGPAIRPGATTWTGWR
ncbi:MAG: hypothetical protein WKG07_01825 [Hymenobacter sp.]